MRKAEVDQAWSKCRAEKKARLDVTALSIFSKGRTSHAPITSRVCALLGENGCGKSTLLRSIYEVFKDGLQQAKPLHLDSITLTFNGTSQTHLNRFNPSAHTAPFEKPTAVLIDSSKDAHTLQAYLSSQANLEEYLAQYEKKKLNEKELQTYREVTNQPYESIELFEIESPLDADEFVPYFIASLPNGIVYDSRTMGFGELCSCYLIWQITRCTNGCIILLDEPDSHLSSGSRRTFTDFLALEAAAKELWIIFSSHSVEPIEKLQENELLLLNRIGVIGAPPIIAAIDKRDAIIQLGLTPSKRFLFVVEDVDAKEFLEQILARLIPRIAVSSETRALVKGAEEILPLMNAFPTDSTVCHLTAVFDGDKKGYIDIPSGVFLPGALDPVLLAIRCVRDKIDALATLLNVDTALLTRAFEEASIRDHHDFCHHLANSLKIQSIDTKLIRKCLFNVLVNDENLQPELHAFCAALVSHLAQKKIF